MRFFFRNFNYDLLISFKRKLLGIDVEVLSPDNCSLTGFTTIDWTFGQLFLSLSCSSAASVKVVDGTSERQRTPYGFTSPPHRPRRVCLYRSPDHPSSSHLLLGTPHETETHAGPTAVFTHCKSRGEPETCPHTNTHNYYLICTICDASSYSFHQVGNSACVWRTHSKIQDWNS